MKTLSKKLVMFVICIFLVASQDGQIRLVEDGRSDYQIVLPAAASAPEQLAAAELQKYLQEISGAKLPIVRDNQAEIAREILLGKARPDLNTPVDFAALNEDGFHIKTSGQRLIIAGGTKKGTLYGVYTFLENYLGCRKYSAAVSHIPKNSSIRLSLINDKQVPLSHHRELHMPDAIRDSSFANWHKIHARPQRQKAWGMWVHTFDDLIPRNPYFETHPEYFSLINGKRSPDFQLCLSNDDVLALLVSGLKKKMAEKPDAHYWSVSQNDTYGPCQCEPCQVIDKKYGGPSGSIIHFVNKVAAKFPDKTISTLAYQYSRAAPTGIIPAKNVNIMLCSIECNRSESIATDRRSAAFRKDIVDWGKLTDNILIWDYVVQFRNYVNPFPNLRVLQPNLQFFVRNNARMMFQQGSGTSWSEFYELRSYIIAKLLWNADVDVNAIIDDFLSGYYDAAAPHLRKYIDQMHDALAAAGDDLQIYGYPYDGIDSYLTPVLIQQYKKLFDAAEAAVADAPAALKRVKTARLPLEFAILEISKRNVNNELSLFKKVDGRWKTKPEMQQRMEAFVAGVKAAGIERLEEHGTTPDEYYAATRTFFEKGFTAHLALNKTVTLQTSHSEKYPVGGGAALTNGLKGINDYHFNWLGFEAQEMDAIVDLGKAEEISEITADFLQDNRAWVWLPENVAFFISQDGKSYQLVGEVKRRRSEKDQEQFTERFQVRFPKSPARFVRVKTQSRIHCPPWHIGAGGDAWIFCDEVVVK